MITTSKNANTNYLCKIVELKGLHKHSNADRLQAVSIDFNNVITGMDAKDGDIYVFFPVESKINKDFLSFTDAFRDKTLNANKEKAGFFEDNCRVRAMRLRGEKSMGYLVPVTEVLSWAGVEEFNINWVGEEFDTINGKLLVEKYQIKTTVTREPKQGKKPSLSRLVEGQVHLHADTENLRKNVHKINPEDTISITYKTHGTSWWVSNVLVKRKLSWLEKLGQKLGLAVQVEEYDLVYGSRRVVKNQSLEDPKAKDHYFGYDLWKHIKDEVGDKIPKGYTLYGEFLGYGYQGEEIQKGYDYGCTPGEHRIEVYRITQTTPDGLVTELSWSEIEEFCKKVNINSSHRFFYGKAMDWLYAYTLQDLYNDEHEWRAHFIKTLEEKYNEKDCFMCNNKVPEEGIVVRKENLFEFEAYKLKSFRFLEWETGQLDKGISDIESEN